MLCGLVVWLKMGCDIIHGDKKAFYSTATVILSGFSLILAVDEVSCLTSRVNCHASSIVCVGPCPSIILCKLIINDILGLLVNKNSKHIFKSFLGSYDFWGNFS